jgi:hypothetical protein
MYFFVVFKLICNSQLWRDGGNNLYIYFIKDVL